MEMLSKNAMQRRLITLLAILLVVGIGANAAFAGDVHFNKSTPPTFTSSGLTLTTTGTVYGLGFGNVTITVNASGTADLLCENPGGSTKVPGHNPAFSASGSATFPATDIKNGHLTFTVTTNPPESPVPGAPACPNSSWTETITGIQWRSATITVEQFGVVVLVQTFPVP